MSLKCVYTDLDGTLLGSGGSLFRDADGGFSLLPARALEACFRAGVEVVIKSGRRESTVMEDARLLGQTSYIYEVGAGVVIDGEHFLLTGDLKPEDGRSIHDQIEDSGAPALLLEHFAGRLEYHDPWHRNREISHLLRGTIDAREANELLQQNGLGHLRLVDNGIVAPRPHLDGETHAFHLIPAQASKAAAVELHMRVREYAPEECIAVGDSLEDLDVARVVGRFFLVANAGAVPTSPNVTVTEGRNGDGFYEAVVSTLAER
jgi:phosphoglycolate phosphatase